MSHEGLREQLLIYSGGIPKRICPSGYLGGARRHAGCSIRTLGDILRGAGLNRTMRNNRRAFSKWQIRPRFCINVESRDLSCELLDHSLAAPLIFAPMGVQSILHRDAERASARAARALGLPYVLSTVSSVSIEEIARECGPSPHWFQLYPGRDPEIVRSFIHRAESSGYSALVVTVDTTMLGWRDTDLRHGYLPFLSGQGMANFLTDPVFLGQLARSPADDLNSAVQHFLSIYVNPAFTWDDLVDIRQTTRLPLIVKGLTDADDVIQAQRVGANAVVVSNHRGRQVDGALATLDALNLLASHSDITIPLLFDSGIRSAADIVKALALGAQAVLIGRPYAYGLAVAGQVGAERVMRHLWAEWDLEMALAGYRSIKELTRERLSRAQS